MVYLMTMTGVTVMTFSLRISAGGILMILGHVELLFSSQKEGDTSVVSLGFSWAGFPLPVLITRVA